MSSAGTAGRSGLPQDVSGAVTAAVVRCVRAHAGDFGLAQVLAAAGERRPLEMLEDPGRWSTHDEAVALLAAAERVTGEPAMALRAGEELAGQLARTDRPAGADPSGPARSPGTPAELLRDIASAAARLTTVSTLDPLEVGETHAVLQAVTRPRLPRHRYLCELTKGMLAQVPVVFGSSPAVVEEPECQARGGRCCLYSMAWEAAPGLPGHVAPTAAGPAGSPGPTEPPGRSGPSGAGPDDGPAATDRARPEDAAGRPAAAGRPLAVAHLLEEAARSVGDAVADGDLDALLATIAARAARAAGARRYLLALRQEPGLPPRVLHAGLDDAEATATARELLEQGRASAGGARLVADVATASRDYGCLAAVYATGEEPPPDAASLLALHAGCAAAALEVRAAVAGAGRAASTVRALVELSGALAASGTIGRACQALADATPSLAGCDRASVLLWDPFEQRFVLQSWSPTASAEPPYEVTADDARMVPLLLSAPGVVVADGAVDEEPLVRDLHRRAGARCTVLTPLRSEEELVGVLLAGYVDPPPCDPRADRDLHDRLRAAAGQAVVALQNAWLLEQAGPLAWHDALTGLPNRRLLEHRARRAMEQPTRAAGCTTVFFVDLDRFKRVNDTYGHAAGDALIRQVAERMRSVVRRQDTVARLGGDEFAVLLPALPDMAAVRAMAEEMLSSLRVPYLVDGVELHASASIGVAVCPGHGDDFDELLIHADEAMYRSKGLGRDTYSVFAPDADDARGPGRGTTLHDADLHHAVERGELYVVYQPSVDLRTNRVVGVEALVRWRHPVHGVLEPAAFLARAEESDVIVDIDAFVLHQVTRQVREWIDQGITPVRVSVNASRRDLVHPRFADSVLAALHDQRVPSELLEIEVAERIGIDAGGPAEAAVGQLRDAGVRFAVDDYGSGASSLRRLASLPVRTVKIDRSLVQRIGPEDELGSLASAIIAMSERLGMECVAEGVETSRQRHTLLQRGCTIAQGYLYGRPLGPEGVERLLRPPSSAAPARGPDVPSPR